MLVFTGTRFCVKQQETKVTSQCMSKTMARAWCGRVFWNNWQAGYFFFWTGPISNVGSSPQLHQEQRKTWEQQNTDNASKKLHGRNLDCTGCWEELTFKNCHKNLKLEEQMCIHFLILPFGCKQKCEENIHSTIYFHNIHKFRKGNFLKMAPKKMFGKFSGPKLKQGCQGCLNSSWDIFY
jgi:hypothetical protein